MNRRALGVGHEPVFRDARPATRSAGDVVGCAPCLRKEPPGPRPEVSTRGQALREGAQVALRVGGGLGVSPRGSLTFVWGGFREAWAWVVARFRGP